jgi:hypothetical protein
VSRHASCCAPGEGDLRQDIQRIADEEQRTTTQVCQMLLYEGVEAYKKEGPKFIQRLVPLGERQVGGHDDGRFFRPLGNGDGLSSLKNCGEAVFAGHRFYDFHASVAGIDLFTGSNHSRSLQLQNVSAHGLSITLQRRRKRGD